jgi:hypothetical protein
MASHELDRLPDDAAVVTKTSTATPEQIWSVLADGFSYSAWVVGASHLRAEDTAWPQPGAKLHHAVGVWPLLIRDSTTVESCVAGRSLGLLASARPFGHARVLLELDVRRDGSVVTMSEAPVSPGLRGSMPRLLWAPLLRARNAESLGRLLALAERHREP